MVWKNITNTKLGMDARLIKLDREDFLEILNNYQGKKIAIVSHGASIKYYLQNFCKYDKESESLIYNGKTVCHKKPGSPCIIKIIFKDNTTVKFEECIN